MGGTGADTFDASLTATGLQTLTATDKLDGGAGDDILIGTLNSSVTPQSITNIETVQVGVVTNASTLDLTNATGVKNVTIAGSTAAATVAGLSKATNVTLRDSALAHTVVFNDVSGSSDAATINIANVTGAPVLTIANVETLTYNSTGATANSVASTVAATGANSLTGATKLNITGTTAINVGTLTAVKTVDGSAHAPTDNVGITASLSASSVTVLGGAGNDSITISSTGNDSVSGGAGNDTITFSTAGGLSLADTIDGGAGTDTLRATAADLTGISGTAPATYTITNIETLSVSNTFAGTLRAPNISTAANRVNIAPVAAGAGAGALGNGTIVGPAGAFTVGLGGGTSGVTYTANDVLGGALTITATGTATTDSLTLNNSAVTSTAGGSALNVFNGQAIAINGYETVALSTGTVGGTANTINTLTVTPDLGGTAAVTITGANGLTFAGVVTANSLDASAVAGAVSMANVANTATTVIGGIGSDTLRGNAALSNSVSGGAGDDVIVGGAGNDTLSGGDGADTITAGAGNDSISGGAGNDVIVMAGNLTSADTIDGGDGVDTLTISTALGTTGAPNFTSVEVLGLSGANNITQDMNAFSGSGITTVLIDGTGDSLTNAASNLTTLLVSNNASTGTLSFARLINTTNDSVTINFAGGGNTTLANGTSFAGEENITMGRYGSTSGAGNTVTFTTPTLTAMQKLTLGGEFNYAIGANGANRFATLDASNATGTVNVNASASTVNFTATVSGAAAVTLTGGSGNDVLPGTAFADSLTGGDGADSITAGAGDDTVSGGRGADTLAGGDGTDTLDYGTVDANNVFDLGGGVVSSGIAVNLGTTAVTAANVRAYSVIEGAGTTAAALSTGLANLAAGTAVYIGAETGAASAVSLVSSVTDTFTGFENVIGSGGADVIIGSSGANSIQGGAGADYIDGGAGNDTINAGTGADYVIGGAGADTIVMVAGDSIARTAGTLGAGAGGTLGAGETLIFGNGVDQISGFVSGTDTIDVTGAGANYALISATGTYTGLTVGNNYAIRGNFVAGTGTFTQSSTGADLLVYTNLANADLSNAANTAAVVLIGVTALTAADFV